jgi:hypothetical protein
MVGELSEVSLISSLVGYTLCALLEGKMEEIADAV